MSNYTKSGGSSAMLVNSGGTQRPPRGRLRMVDPYAEPTNRNERRARDAWLRVNAKKRGMTPDELLAWLKSLTPEQCADAIAGGL